MKRSYSDIAALVAAAPVYVPPPKVEKRKESWRFGNVDYIQGEDGPEPVPRSMSSIFEDMNEKTDRWPRRVGRSLFIRESNDIHWLPKTPNLFGWLHSKLGGVQWETKVGMTTKDEFFSEVCRTSMPYDSIETLPHFPPLAKHYYSCPEYAKGSGAKLDWLVERFCPVTEFDRQLIKALFVTPFWGGKAGGRPVFSITSEEGRGVGKSKLSDMVSYLCGGHIEMSAQEDAGRTRTRLLSPEGLKVRIARYDNIKSFRFSMAELESIITAPFISGHKLNYGESTRPNDLTWIMTLNGPSLGTDMAQRVVTISLAKPERTATWEEETLAFIDRYRDQIFGDIKAFFEIEPAPLSKVSRWGEWEQAVVGRLPDTGEIQKLIATKAAESNSEHEELEIVEEYFRERLDSLGYVFTRPVHVPTTIAHEWYCKATNTHLPVASVSRALSQASREGSLTKLKINPSRNYGRGFLYIDNDSSAEAEAIYDIQERIAGRDRGYPTDDQKELEY